MALLRLLLVRRKLLKITRFQPKLLEIPSFYCPCVVTQETAINIQELPRPKTRLSKEDKTRKSPRITQDGAQFCKHLDWVNEMQEADVVDLKRCRVGSLDFSKLFTTVPLLMLIMVITYMINFVYDLKLKSYGCDELYIVCPRYCAVGGRNQVPKWHQGPIPVGGGGETFIYVSREKLIEWSTFVAQNAYVTFGGSVWLQLIGFPMGSNCSPEFANLFLAYFEMAFIIRCFERYGRQLPRGLWLMIVFGCRYMDDQWHLLLDGFDFETVLYDEREIGGTDGLYPCRLRGPDGEWIDYPLKLNVEGIGIETSFLDVLSTVDRKIGRLGYDCYDKREAMPCFKDRRTFPHIDTVLNEVSKRSVLLGEMYRFDRRTSTVATFVRWTVLKATAMIKNRYPRKWIIRQLQRFQGLSPGKGNWDLIRTQILREVDGATGDRT